MTAPLARQCPPDEADCECPPCLALIRALDHHLVVIGRDADRRATRQAVRTASRAVDERHDLNRRIEAGAYG